MITAHRLEVRAGARLLMADVSFRVGAGDKIGLVGRNGAGKTTLTRILAGEALPASGTVTGGGSVGYLPQDPRTGDPDVLALHRILSARGLDEVVRRLREAEHGDGLGRPGDPGRGMRRYEKADAALHAGGGYAAEAEARQIASSLNIADRSSPSRCAPCPVASGAASSWPASCSPAPRRCSSTSPPTTSTPTRSCGCGTSCKRLQGRPDRHQPRRRPARGMRQQGAPPRRQPRRGRRLQHGLDDVPRPARDRRAPPPARAAERRAQGRAR